MPSITDELKVKSNEEGSKGDHEMVLMPLSCADHQPLYCRCMGFKALATIQG